MSETQTDHGEHEEPTRRDFIYIATGAAAAIGAGAIAWPMVTQMGAAADTRAAGSIEIDVSKVEEGQQLKVLWRGKPVFVRYRTQKEIDYAESVDVADLCATRKQMMSVSSLISPAR